MAFLVDLAIVAFVIILPWVVFKILNERIKNGFLKSLACFIVGSVLIAPMLLISRDSFFIEQFVWFRWLFLGNLTFSAYSRGMLGDGKGEFGLPKFFLKWKFLFLMVFLSVASIVIFALVIPPPPPGETYSDFQGVLFLAPIFILVFYFMFFVIAKAIQIRNARK